MLPSRLLRSTAFEAAAIANWLALPLLKAPVGGLEPPLVGLTGRCLTVWPHRINKVRTAGFEPAVSCSRGTRNARLSHVLISKPCKSQKQLSIEAMDSLEAASTGIEPANTRSIIWRSPIEQYAGFYHGARLPERPAGVEPAHPPWQGDRLPLHHGRLVGSRIVKDQEHRVGIEPTSPRYEGGIFAARRPVLS